MKSKFRFIAFLLVVASVFTLSSCKLSVLSADKLIRPPKSGIEIASVIEKTAGESIVLKSPVNANSDFSSSLTLIDLDSDGTEEAVVFYTTASNENDVHINVLRLEDDEWTSVGDFSGYGNNIETLSFRSLSEDMSQCDIIATWSYIDSKVLTIHKLKNEGRRSELKLVTSQQYASVGFVDVDFDSSYELFIINGDFADKTKSPTAKVIKVNDFDVKNIGMISLSKDIVGFENSYCQQLNNSEIPMIAVYDYVNSSGLYGTDVVYWDSERSTLKLMQVDSKTNSAFSTLRSIHIQSNDINADTFIEIPVQEPIVGSSIDQNMSSLNYTKWCELVPSKNGVNLKPYGSLRFYFTDKDYFDVSSSVASQITVLRNTQNDSWTVVSYDTENLFSNKTLMTVVGVSPENIDKYVSYGYKQLSSNSTDNKVIMYLITEDGKSVGISEKDLINIQL